MRCNWRRWLWGLIPLLMVSWVAVLVERTRIEQDLGARAKSALERSGSPWAGVEVNGRDVVLTGRAIQDSEPPRAEGTVRKVWGIREVENRAILPPKIEPFLWSARRRGNRVRLSGYVPDRATRQAVLGMTKAAMPSLEVVDKMNTGRGVPSPDTWLAGLSFALKQLSLLKQGEARFEDLSLTISGEADDVVAYKTVQTALKSGLPKGMRLASAQIAGATISPFAWSAQFSGGQLLLSGYQAGGDKTRADLLAAIKQAAPAITVVDRMEPAEGAPQGWMKAAAILIKELVRLETGTAEMKDAALSVSGTAADEAQAQSVRAALRAGVPSSFTLVDQIKVREIAVPPPPAVPLGPSPFPQESAPRPPVDAPKAASAPPAPTPQPGESAPPQAMPPPSPPQPAEPKVQQAVPAPQAAPEPAQPQQAAPAPPAEPAPKQASPAPAPPAPGPKQTAERAPAPPAPPPPRAEPAPKAAAAPPQPPPASVPPQVTACQSNLNSIAHAGLILFPTNSAALDPGSFATLDRLAAAAKVCPGMHIAIEGHTDAEGSSDYNQRLSERRAQAVAAYLVKAGADKKQLEAVGYGFTRPAAPNDTEDNMARNRRIEFSVRQP